MEVLSPIGERVYSARGPSPSDAETKVSAYARQESGRCLPRDRRARSVPLAGGRGLPGDSSLDRVSEPAHVLLPQGHPRKTEDPAEAHGALGLPATVGPVQTRRAVLPAPEHGAPEPRRPVRDGGPRRVAPRPPRPERPLRGRNRRARPLVREQGRPLARVRDELGGLGLDDVAGGGGGPGGRAPPRPGGGGEVPVGPGPPPGRGA